MNNRPTRSQIYKRDKNSCQYCGATTKLTIDHVIPRSKGGTRYMGKFGSSMFFV